VIFYLIMDTLVDSFFPVLSDFDDAIDGLESAILKNPTEEQLGTLFDMKREILRIRKVIGPQRDMIAALKKAGGSPRYTELPFVGHNSWDSAYVTPELYQWFLKQSTK